MLTILLTIVGLIVFIISLFTVGFKSGYKRLMLFAVTGLILDVILTTIYIGVVFFLA